MTHLFAGPVLSAVSQQKSFRLNFGSTFVLISPTANSLTRLTARLYNLQLLPCTRHYILL